jgi:hypothetical protein
MKTPNHLRPPILPLLTPNYSPLKLKNDAAISPRMRSYILRHGFCKSLLLSRHSRLLRSADGNIIGRTRIRIRPLTLTRLRQLLASDRSLSAMAFNRLGTVVVLISLLAIGRLWSQEAVETSTPAKETASEPSPTREKTAKTEATAKPAKSLEETMRPEEFKAAGLDKLNEDELQHLDAYLQGYRQSAQKKAAEKAQAEAQVEIKKANEKADQATEEAKKSAMTKLDSLVSRVDGTIEGVKGHAVIRLEDGTVWKQANADDRYRATVTDHPAAVVLHTYLGYKMRIEGMPEFYVDPVRP